MSLHEDVTFSPNFIVFIDNSHMSNVRYMDHIGSIIDSFFSGFLGVV